MVSLGRCDRVKVRRNSPTSSDRYIVSDQEWRTVLELASRANTGDPRLLSEWKAEFENLDNRSALRVSAYIYLALRFAIKGDPNRSPSVDNVVDLTRRLSPRWTNVTGEAADVLFWVLADTVGMVGQQPQHPIESTAAIIFFQGVALGLLLGNNAEAALPSLRRIVAEYLGNHIGFLRSLDIGD